MSSRIAELDAMAATGKANKVTTDLAYSLFGKLVRYPEMYQTNAVGDSQPGRGRD